MADPDFWRELATDFFALCGAYDAVWAQWLYRVKSGVVGDWQVRGPASQLASFEALARRGATRIPHPGISDLLIAWLEALRIDGSSNFQMGEPYEELDDAGNRVATWMPGKIVRLCEASANYCKKLESAALQAEYEERQRSERPEPQPVPAASKPESIGEQIRRLREECRLSQEALAPKIGIKVRSIQRHETGKHMPRAEHLAAYERLFSKVLKRQVLIKQNVVKTS